MSDSNGKTEARELGLIMGKLEGIQQSQREARTEITATRTDVASIRTDIAVMRSEQAERAREIADLSDRVDSHSRDLHRIRGSWKTALVKYGATGGAGAGALAALMRLFGIKLGVGE